MSVYYYLHAEGTNEYVELTSGSWYSYMSDMYDILVACTKARKPYSEFVSLLRKKKVFEGFYDNYLDEGNGYIDKDFEKYFLIPTYNWAFENCVKGRAIVLTPDCDLDDVAISYLCSEKGIEFKKGCGWNLPDEVQAALDDFHKKGGRLWGTYLKKICDISLTDKNVANGIGVSFERALAELRAGKVIWRTDDDTFYWLNEDDYCITNNFEGGPGLETKFLSEDIMADDWHFRDRTPEEIKDGEKIF